MNTVYTYLIELEHTNTQIFHTTGHDPKNRIGKKQNRQYIIC